jgi:alanyl-tRNA synthetase
MKQLSGAEIRQSFINFFISKGHTFVRSASLVPGGDQTLLFTNAGMVQFKDVFLGTDKRPYTRAVNSQKCLRVAGKHNDLEEVGRDDSHHTFFEMLGNWSFGDYYKKEAIEWAWELLTVEWELPADKLWATYFFDDKGDIPADEEARDNWLKQKGMLPEHVLRGGRKDNFWEMAETGPCGPCSEIHIDRGPEGCNKQGVPGHICKVNGDCIRYLELWNLVFIQYNRQSASVLEPLPAKHVDTGMGLERIVSIMQGVTSNYKTDLLLPLMKTIQSLAGQSDKQMMENYTPYRVIADHARACSFLIADGVIPGNTGRNYITRMIARRAARFGGKIGLDKPFLAKVAEAVVSNYGAAYPELEKNKKTIFDNLTREEIRFHRTLESGMGQLDDFIEEMKKRNINKLSGELAFELYATHGLPLEITRDILEERGLSVDDIGFKTAMDEHRVASGGGKAMGEMGGGDVAIYSEILSELVNKGKLTRSGVKFDPYSRTSVDGEVLSIIQDGIVVDEIAEGEEGEIILPETCFYIESGGQVTDKGKIISLGADENIFEVSEMRKPAAGVIIHVGKMLKGTLTVGQKISAQVDAARRQDIRRNHTATHLLHAELHKVIGKHALQAGSMVSPDRLRFDFNHPEAVTQEQLEKIEAGVNYNILNDYKLEIKERSLQEAMNDGATALFGEKYGEIVRTVIIGGDERISFELCGGTHVDETGDIGLFLITSEGSAAAGIRRIEAVTGRAAYALVQQRTKLLKQSAALMQTSQEELPKKIEQVLSDSSSQAKQIVAYRVQVAGSEFQKQISDLPLISDSAVYSGLIPGVDLETLRSLTDQFKTKYASGAVILATIMDDKPSIVVSVSDDLVKNGINAGEIARAAAQIVGGSGGGRPNLAQAGGKDASRLNEALETAENLVKSKLIK